MKPISFVIPARDNLKYLKWAYASIRKNLHPITADGVYYHEIVMADDASSDGTWSWLKEIASKDRNVKIYHNPGPHRMGLTILYDLLVEDFTTNDRIMFFHADMYAAPGLDVEVNRHLDKKVAVCATRVEPPLHPEGPEKIVEDFGFEPEDFKEREFLKFVDDNKSSKITNGIFAPWAVMKQDYWDIGGHDPLYAPQSKEDSDVFNRFSVAGFEFIQTWAGLVYHLTSRGSRFRDGVGKDSEEWKWSNSKNMRNFARKWGTNVQHDPLMKPIVSPRFDIGFVVENCGLESLSILEPWCDRFYSDCSYENVKRYQKEEQPNTLYNLTNKIRPIPTESVEDSDINDITIEFDAKKLNQDNFQFLTRLGDIIDESGEVGQMKYDIFRLTIHKKERFEKDLVACKN